MRSKASIFGVLVLSAVLFAAPALAQNVVQYTGTLQMGFGDSDVTTVPPSMNGLPVCAPQVTPFTFATVPMDGFAYQDPNSGMLRFLGQNPLVGGGNPAAIGGGQGGAQTFALGVNDCNIKQIPFVNPRFRSRTQIADMLFPARQGGVASPATTMSLGGNTNVQFDGVAVYDVGPGLGFPEPAGVAFSVDQPYFGNLVPSANKQTIQPGANHFGGGIPWQGGGAVQLGVNLATLTPGGLNPLQTYGVHPYAGGLLPTDPTIFGTDKNFGPPLVAGVEGYIGANINGTFALHSPGGTPGQVAGLPGYVATGPFTVNNVVPPQGRIVTAGMGVVTFPNTAVPVSMRIPLISPISFAAGFQRWTTGVVRHSDTIGDFITDRNAAGADTTGLAGVSGTTRHLTLVTPWSANIKATSVFGLLPNDIGFGGTGIIDINIIPVPEPGSLALLGFGVAGLLGLRSMKRRN